jgi:hypothetical protein
MPSEQEQAYREEAERLKLLPPAIQRDFLRAFRLGAKDKRLSRRDRRAALARVKALETLLGL